MFISVIYPNIEETFFFLVCIVVKNINASCVVYSVEGNHSDSETNGFYN